MFVAYSIVNIKHLCVPSCSIFCSLLLCAYIFLFQYTNAISVHVVVVQHIAVSLSVSLKKSCLSHKFVIYRRMLRLVSKHVNFITPCHLPYVTVTQSLCLKGQSNTSRSKVNFGHTCTQSLNIPVLAITLSFIIAFTNIYL